MEVTPPRLISTWRSAGGEEEFLCYFAVTENASCSPGKASSVRLRDVRSVFCPWSQPGSVLSVHKGVPSPWQPQL